MARLNKSDWLEEGFKILQQFAQNKLRILYLCERLKVTRGSFYHHFSSIDNYISELIGKWEKENTLAFIKAANKAVSPMEKMMILTEKVRLADQSIEAAIRSWSFYNDTVKQHLDKVDEIRIGYLHSLFEQMGDSSDEALIKAKFDYATLIGIQQLYPNISPEEMARFYDLFGLKV